MLEAVRPYGAPCRPYRSPLIRCEQAREPWQLAGYWELRRAIFCEEKALFACADDERDRHDDVALPIVACSFSAGNPERVVGVVRIFESEPGIFYGGRLGVDRDYRTQPRVAASLIKHAVGTARTLGCRRFLATVLEQNARYFSRFQFRPLERLELCATPHVLMEASLAAFLPCEMARIPEPRAA